MTKSIYKYRIDVAVGQQIAMPAGAVILSVQGQDPHRGTIWALVDEDHDRTYRTLNVYGTGHPMPDNPGRYIGTWQAGAFVWHLFEEAI